MENESGWKVVLRSQKKNLTIYTHLRRIYSTFNKTIQATLGNVRYFREWKKMEGTGGKNPHKKSRNCNLKTD